MENIPESLAENTGDGRMGLLKEEEIKKLKENAIDITPEDVFQDYKPGDMKTKKLKDMKLKHPPLWRTKPTKPMIMSNGYVASLSVTHLRPTLDVIHLSVMNTKGKTDHAEADIMAKEILVEGFGLLGEGELLKNNIHYMKFVIKEAGTRK